MSRYYEGGMLARCERCGGVLGRTERPLTKKQAVLYRYLAMHIEAFGFAPSFDEIAVEFDYHSLATVHEHLVNLERKGWIKRRYNESRAIECLVSLDDSAPVRVGSDET